MDGFNMTQLAALLLAGGGIGGLIYLTIMPYLSGEKKTEKRVSNFAVNPGRQVRSGNMGNSNEANRRKRVQATLEELDEKHKESEKVSLHLRIIRAGLEISNEQFLLYSLITAFTLCGGVLLFLPGSYITAGLAFFVGGFFVPRIYLNTKTKKRQKQFIAEFANAIDIIIRGVRSGLPLNDCMQIIASEIPAPVGPEYASLLEQIRVGVTLEEALGRMYKRVPLQEVNFFAIVLSIQAKTGGNLAETLSNLSSVLRERKKLINKVHAFSQEAKSSAAIIGALPIVVMGLVYLSNPDYINLLFEDPTGNLLLAAGAALMLTGVMIMRKMINFDF